MDKISPRMHQYITAAGIGFKDWFPFAVRDFDGRLHPAAHSGMSAVELETLLFRV